MLATDSGPDAETAEAERLEEARKNREELSHRYLTAEELEAAKKWDRK